MRRALALAAALLLGLPAALLAGLWLFFDPDSLRPRLEAEASRALGLPVRIGAPLALDLGLQPGLALGEVTVTGADGAPALTLERGAARLALAPLLAGRVVLARVELEGGMLRAEPAAWARPARPTPATAAPAPQASGGPVLELRAAVLRRWQIRQGEAVIALTEAKLDQRGPDAPLRLEAALAWRGVPVTARGEAPGPGGPWALTASAAGATARLGLARDAAGWRAALAAEAPALEPLGALAGQPLPALTGLRLEAAAQLRDGGAEIETLTLQLGGGALMGVTLSEASARIEGPGAPLRFRARGAARGLDLALEGEAEAQALARGAPGALRLVLAGAGGEARLEGRWPEPLRLTAALPALAPLAEAAGRPLPALRDLSLRATLRPEGAAGFDVEALEARSSAGDLSGRLALRRGARPSVAGQLASDRLDLAALRPVAAPAAPGPSPAAAPAPAGPARLIPDQRLDLAALRGFDADLGFRVAELLAGGQRITALEGRFVNADGRASLDPFAATLAAGRVQLRAAADATRAPPVVQVAGGGEGLDLAALLRLLGGEAPSTGRADLDFDLRGQGDDLRALAATLTGHLGLAVIEGRLGGTLARTLGQLSPALGQGVPMACLALRAQAESGLVRFPALFLDGAAGRIAGEGTLRLADEALALRLLTDLRIGGLRVRAPVPLRGTLMSPRLEGQGLLEGALQGQAAPMPDCAATLRLARGGRDGPVPAMAAAPAEREVPGVPPAVNNLLRGLLGR
ncbi:MAG: AsmA family protein [Rubritepida sp.]|nr:AsmA family protein [Rubritepida sp.]